MSTSNPNFSMKVHFLYFYFGGGVGPVSRGEDVSHDWIDLYKNCHQKFVLLANVPFITDGNE